MVSSDPPGSLGTGESTELREWSLKTYRMALDLKVKPEQEGFVAGNAVSLAQAYFHPEARPLGIFLGERAVGFVMFSVEDLDKGILWVWRLMVGSDYQGQGLGRMAMASIIEYAQAMGGVTELRLSHSVKEGNPGPFYKSLGFEYTGEIEHEEPIMCRSIVG